MSLIHLIGGDKGGVGRSLYTQVLGQCYQLNHVPFRVVEADLKNPDVAFARLDWEVATVLFPLQGNDFSDPDMLLQWAKSSDVIVNLPPRSSTAVENWLKNSQALERAPLQGIQLCHWWLSDKTWGSLRLFVETLLSLKGGMQHIFVKNKGLCHNWHAFEEHEGVQSLLALQNIPVIEFPALDESLALLLEINPLALDVDRADLDLSLPELNEIKKFLTISFSEIASLNLLPVQQLEFAS